MFRRPLRYYFFNFLLLTFYLLGCAPEVALPPQYRELDLTLEEIIRAVRKDIDTLKVTAGINIEKDDKPHLYIDAVILLKKPDWLNIRLYKFGIPVGEFLVMEDGRVRIADVLSEGGEGKLNDKLRRNLKELSKRLYQSFFWWEGLSCCREDTVMSRNEEEYIIKAEDREIHLDKATLLPRRQELINNDKKISILYEESRREGDFWYASLMKIESGNYRVSLRIERLTVNPPLEEIGG